MKNLAIPGSVLALLILSVLRCMAVDASPVGEVPSPAARGSSSPSLFATRGGDLLMSWLEPEENSTMTAVKIARLKAGKWSPAVTVVRRDDLFVNWADFPSIVQAADGTLVASTSTWPRNT